MLGESRDKGILIGNGGVDTGGAYGRQYIVPVVPYISTLLRSEKVRMKRIKLRLQTFHQSVCLWIFRFSVMLLLCFMIRIPVWASLQDTEIPSDDRLFEMSIEDLMALKITSVSKKTQKLSDAAAAVYVITNDDIRRSGANSVPEVLRMVPGLQVAQVNANQWAISSRGFNSSFANKLLVLIDGRSVYTPLFSGVIWSIQDLPLMDVERIEVIRGPGATLWGANAVNGVINILTKKAKDTQGLVLETGIGTEEKGFGTIRYGGNINNRTYFRIYAKYFDRDAAVFPDGKDADDNWAFARSGFRLDHRLENDDSMTVQGDVYSGYTGWTITTVEPPPFYSLTQSKDDDFYGGNILCRWEHVVSDGSEISLQTYYDRTERESLVIGEWRDTIDLDFQHRFEFSKRHEFIWGLGYRYTQDRLENTFNVMFADDSRSDNLLSGFFQDEIKSASGALSLTLGSKFEYNDYTGFEVQPNIRLLYKPDDHQSIWASVSRAVRTPSRSEADMRMNVSLLPPNTLGPGSPLTYFSYFGSDAYDSETLYAFELGYRIFPIESLSVDVATFYNIYSDLATSEPGTLFYEVFPLPPHLVVSYVADNGMEGSTYGAELALDWRYADLMNLKLSYTFFKMHLSPEGDSLDTFAASASGDNPTHQISLRPSINLGKELELDLWARYVDNIPNRNVDSYTSLDIRLAWKPWEHTEFTLVGQNLLDDRHPEFDESQTMTILRTEIERSVYGKITIWF